MDLHTDVEEIVQGFEPLPIVTSSAFVGAVPSTQLPLVAHAADILPCHVLVATYYKFIDLFNSIEEIGRAHV